MQLSATTSVITLSILSLAYAAPRPAADSAIAGLPAVKPKPTGADTVVPPYDPTKPTGTGTVLPPYDPSKPTGTGTVVPGYDPTGPFNNATGPLVQCSGICDLDEPDYVCEWQCLPNWSCAAVAPYCLKSLPHVPTDAIPPIPTDAYPPIPTDAIPPIPTDAIPITETGRPAATMTSSSSATGVPDAADAGMMSILPISESATATAAAGVVVERTVVLETDVMAEERCSAKDLERVSVMKGRRVDNGWAKPGSSKKGQKKESERHVRH